MSDRRFNLDRETFMNSIGRDSGAPHEPITNPMAATAHQLRTSLRLVGSTSEAESSWSWFCGHCGAQPRVATPAPVARVCDSCGLGLLLETRSDAVPNVDDAFLVVDSSLSVQAMSRRAELALGVREGQAVNRHVTELLIPAAAEGSEPVNLATAITCAARGEDDPCRVFVRPTNTFGVRLGARIAACGPPRAALLVLE
jgi:hypothetical protein